jgi:hypothetical protein
MKTDVQNVGYDYAAIGVILDDIASSFERAMAGVASLKAQLVPENNSATLDFDPKDPANKHTVGGLEKFTDRGIEICYRLFDARKTRYAVSELMDISFGAANHRFKAWEKAGGFNRSKQNLN